MQTIRYDGRRMKAALAVFVILFTIALMPFSKNEVEAMQFNSVQTENTTVKTNIVERRVKLESSQHSVQEINSDFNIMAPSGYTEEELSRALTSDAHQAMKPYISTIVKAERTYGINALYLLCKFGLESGWGRYMSAENNIAGWTNDDGSFRDFDSVEDCIMHVAKNISTTYRETVGTKLGDVCERYCPNTDYAETLIQIMTERSSKI